MDRHDPAFGDGLDIGIGFGAEAADGQAGSGERVAVEELGGQAQLAADLAHFVFVVGTQRLDDAARVDQLLNAGRRGCGGS